MIQYTIEDTSVRLLFFTLGISTEVTMDLIAGVDMTNFLTGVVREVFKQALINVFCKADLIIIFIKRREKEENKFERFNRNERTFIFWNI